MTSRRRIEVRRRAGSTRTASSLSSIGNLGAINGFKPHGNMHLFIQLSGLGFRIHSIPVSLSTTVKAKATSQKKVEMWRANQM